MWVQLTELKALLGCVGQVKFVMGCISQLQDGRYFLEDMSDSLPINLEHAQTTSGFFTGDGLLSSFFRDNKISDDEVSGALCRAPHTSKRDSTASAWHLLPGRFCVANKEHAVHIAAGMQPACRGLSGWNGQASTCDRVKAPLGSGVFL